MLKGDTDSVRESRKMEYIDPRQLTDLQGSSLVVGIHKAVESRKTEIRRSCWIRSRKGKLALWMRRRWDAKVAASPEGRLRCNAPVEGHCRAGRRTGHMVGTLRWKKLDDFTIGDETLIQSENTLCSRAAVAKKVPRRRKRKRTSHVNYAVSPSLQLLDFFVATAATSPNPHSRPVVSANLNFLFATCCASFHD